MSSLSISSCQFLNHFSFRFDYFDQKPAATSCIGLFLGPSLVHLLHASDKFRFSELSHYIPRFCAYRKAPIASRFIAEFEGGSHTFSEPLAVMSSDVDCSK
jgi:hypothetical protein